MNSTLNIRFPVQPIPVKSVYHTTLVTMSETKTNDKFSFYFEDQVYLVTLLSKPSKYTTTEKVKLCIHLKV